MNAYDRFREICLSLPETSEVFVENWGHPTFRVGPNDKMFASCSPADAEHPSLGMKVDKAHQAALVNSDPRYTEAAYVGRHGWIQIDASGALDWDEIRELVIESYCLNAPKRLATEVGRLTSEGGGSASQPSPNKTASSRSGRARGGATG